MSTGVYRQGRRGFIKAIGGLGLALACRPAWVAAQPHGLIRKPIPSSGEQLPVIGMGTSRTFDVGDDAQARAALLPVLRAFFDQGGALIDSSPMYGSSEHLLGDMPQVTEGVDLQCPECMVSLLAEGETCPKCAAPIYAFEVPLKGMVYGCLSEDCGWSRWEHVDSAWDDQFVEVFEHVLALFAVHAAIGRHIRDAGFFVQVVADNLGHKGIHDLVIRHAGAGCIGDGHVALAPGPHQSGDAQQGFRVEGLGIQEQVVHPPVDRVGADRVGLPHRIVGRADPGDPHPSALVVGDVLDEGDERLRGQRAAFRQRPDQPAPAGVLGGAGGVRADLVVSVLEATEEGVGRDVSIDPELT